MPCQDGDAGAQLAVAGGHVLAHARDSHDDRLAAVLAIAEAHRPFVSGAAPQPPAIALGQGRDSEDYRPL